MKIEKNINLKKNNLFFLVVSLQVVFCVTQNFNWYSINIAWNLLCEYR